MKRPLLFYLLFFLALSGGLQAQRTAYIIDSLETELQKAPRESIRQVDILNDLGYHYWIVNSNESIRYGEDALQMAQKIGYVEGEALAHRVLGVSYWTMGRPKLALEYLTGGETIYRDIGDAEGAANCLMNTGMVYADIGDFEKALDIYDRAIEQFTSLGLNQRIATTFTKIGSVHLQEERLDEAKEYLTNALNMHSDLGYDYGMAEAHNRLGILYLLEEELELADYHLKKSLELGERVNDEDGRISNLVQLGKLHRLRKDYENAESTLLPVLAEAREKQLKRYELGALKELKLLKKEEGELAESLAYYDAFVALRDSIYNTEKSKQIAAMEFNKELEDKERAIVLLQERERTNSIIKWSLGLGALALAVIGFLLFNHQRQRRIKGQELAASKEELAKTALENARLKQTDLTRRLEFKNKELTSYTLNFVQKNELLQQLQEKLDEAKNAHPVDQNRLLEQLRRDIAHHVNIDKNWKDFKRFFEEVHTDFHKRLKEKHPQLSSNDIKISSLTRLNLNVKETASILGISPESAKTARYRLRKKLDLDSGEELLDYFLRMEKE